ncbi:Ig-like domain-containing protein [Dokdonia sp. Hel_I_53]|uniref:Ig-like domain-containing protein n=1 Tax=Dokdonia sp. Hel_I_53 TaxID=1566287 RepID=UPI0011A3925A|nr:Ig-like domain-containing protein [Dokdonia sp. Hel_I_53]
MENSHWYHVNLIKGIKLAILMLLLSITLTNCAKRGRPEGGAKDSIPPVFVKATPPNFTTNFDADEVRIYFDEFIKLKDLQKQLIVSPPIENYSISPQGSASKYIKISIQDTLAENTTYVFNFGLSIVDNNEGNPFASFKYVLSTGNFVDSLKVKGTIIDAVKEKPANFVTVMLYKADSSYTDSIIYKERPLYVTNTLDSLTTFELDYLKEGKYALVAMKDEDANFTFQPKKDQIGFLQEFITVPADTSYTLKLFSEELAYKSSRPKHAAQGRIAFGIEGDRDSISIKRLTTVDKKLTTIITEKAKDTLYYWYKPKITLDSLIFNVKAPGYSDILQVRIRTPKQDSLSFSSRSRTNIPFDKPYRIQSNIPLDSIKKELIKVVEDSTEIPFTYSLEENTTALDLNFDRKEATSYKIQMMPNAITDFFGQKNDTLTFSAKTKELSDYGEIELTLSNATNFPYIIQLLDSDMEVIEKRYATEELIFTFGYLNPGQYRIRIIEDANKNRTFDTGSFLSNRQPEKVINYPKVIEVRPSWFAKELFELNTNNLPATIQGDDIIEE